MAAADTLIDVSTALGRGIYSVGEDIVLGFQRTGEGFGLMDENRTTEIGAENRAMAGLLKNAFDTGIKDKNGPIYRAIVHILEHYYSYFPDETLRLLGRQAGLGLGYAGGRFVIGKKLAEFVATRIAGIIATSAAYKRIATRIGVSAGASATGVGVPIGLLMAQGLMQRSSHASHRLKAKSPRLHRRLQSNGDLHLLYFLLEKPLEKYVNAIAVAEKTPKEFKRSIKSEYGIEL